MNVWIDEKELDEVKARLAEWSSKITGPYQPNRKIVNDITEQEFFTLVKRVTNLEIQNKENAKLKLSDFKIADILRYLMEYQEVEAVLYVDSSHEYDIKTNFSHIHGSGKDRVIIVH